MKNAVILHGTGNNPDKDWIPYVKNGLEEKNYKVWAPKLPDSKKPNVDKYNPFLLSGWKYDSETVLVGHSSGAVAILSLLQNLPDGIAIDKAILVAGFINNLDWDALDDLFI